MIRIMQFLNSAFLFMLKSKFPIICFLIMYLLSGCRFLNDQSEGTIATASQLESEPTVTIPASPTTFLILPTASPTTTLTPTPTLLPTLPPLPTLAPDAARAKILELLETNGGCRLPCFWGITPGETTWAEAYNFLDSLSAQITTQSIPSKVSESFTIAYTVPKYVRAVEYMVLYYRSTNNIIEYISADATISLSELLTEYGRPDDVWIRAMPFGMPLALEFFLGIYYPDQGIVAVFYQEKASFSRPGYIYGCFDKNDSRLSNNPYLELWSSKITITWKDVDPFESFEDQPSLVDATGMDLETFYQAYKDPNKKPCIETPEELW